VSNLYGVRNIHSSPYKTTAATDKYFQNFGEGGNYQQFRNLQAANKALNFSYKGSGTDSRPPDDCKHSRVFCTDDAVGIWAGRSGFESQQWHNIINFFSISSNQAVGPNQPPIPWVLEFILGGSSGRSVTFTGPIATEVNL
jgi:hypothetical protein